MVTAGYPGQYGKPVLIRRSNPADIPEIASLEAEAFIDPWGEEGLREAMNNYLTSFFVAVADGMIIGFCGGGIENTGDIVYGHLCTLAIRPQYRQQGIGSELVATIEHDFLLLGATAVELEVRISNRDAIAFYRRLGYRAVFCYTRYYKDGEDGVVMMKWFAS
ncbi:MAG: ribosomal-protein-alanine N-acetyltransferase [Methanocalculus sp. MSAO_Arc1]|uniref:ribosomal protein S18-alanine N-acetyltransferase n=1 Tax=Methanocalculus TaxID=71151 RepID=UPI000FF4E669|nr:MULTISPECIES: ribosomal protein S18-alanine N-acetyltransferase [unclassified Methanocalculus]MCP1661675.1 ribosomal-protein-alanine N-acetyltransferase [Methanocalculus sp. AMF5]RQD81419.1 MAG: ribosomal-protein-alanine N-acetyltransferase [Methanocalculus sp. MSAO_Arc1]